MMNKIYKHLLAASLLMMGGAPQWLRHSIPLTLLTTTSSVTI